MKITEPVNFSENDFYCNKRVAVKLKKQKYLFPFHVIDVYPLFLVGFKPLDIFHRPHFIFTDDVEYIEKGD